MTPTPDTRHLTPEEVEQWAVGLLRAARAIHLAQCHDCLAVAQQERQFFRALAKLERFGPAAGFADRVMAKVRLPTPSGGFERP